ncbi:hypothetical protein CDCA_CDCA03G1131 [Cyanidium caldarium]|uniref:BPL/LPL catalytic domain-containing protein n=1 Tax=Cyanidium caldarium TaxID=2771 RepID=A0AAV9ISS1_CYACA|nr:hypothetical protein CDCA_CDCA03G1131 [Cyanidium caldarium]
MRSSWRRVLVHVSESANVLVNLAKEEHFVRKLPASSDTLMLLLYRNDPAVVIGRNQNPWRECDLHHLAERSRQPATTTQLVRRRSGGGTVYHDRGNWNYALVIPRPAFSRAANAQLLVRAVRQYVGLQLERNDRHDLLWRGHKVGGSAYRLTGDWALHHGTLLLRADLAEMTRCLSPTRFGEQHRLQAKGTSSVRATVDNLVDVAETMRWQLPAFAMALARAAADVEGAPAAATPIEMISDAQLDATFVWREVAALSAAEWVLGETPPFRVHLGEVSVGTAPAELCLVCHGKGATVDALQWEEVEASARPFAGWMTHRWSQLPRPPRLDGAALANTLRAMMPAAPDRACRRALAGVAEQLARRIPSTEWVAQPHSPCSDADPTCLPDSSSYSPPAPLSPLLLERRVT